MKYIQQIIGLPNYGTEKQEQNPPRYCKGDHSEKQMALIVVMVWILDFLNMNSLNIGHYNIFVSEQERGKNESMK